MRTAEGAHLCFCPLNLLVILRMPPPSSATPHIGLAPQRRSQVVYPAANGSLLLRQTHSGCGGFSSMASDSNASPALAMAAPPHNNRRVVAAQRGPLQWMEWKESYRTTEAALRHPLLLPDASSYWPLTRTQRWHFCTAFATRCSSPPTASLPHASTLLCAALCAS